MAAATHGADSERPLPLKSGIEFASADVRSLQADDFLNPGMLWVTRGESLWGSRQAAGQKACSDCHGRADQSMRGVAAKYPAHDAAYDRIVNLEQRINACRSRHQGMATWPYESEPLLSISAYVAHQSRGLPVDGPIVSPALRESFERGRTQYRQRIGQMNLACVHCHQQNWGRTLLAQTISQGHGNGYPAYRLEWQSVGSLQRRLRACYFGVRAEMPHYEAQELLDLEVYLAWRGRGLPIEAPGVRR
jgi:sulfur-oxidizing protein SoxA